MTWPWQQSSVIPEEHHISVPGIELSFNYATRTVFMVDQTGKADVDALGQLEGWLKAKGWFLFVVAIQNLPGAPQDRLPGGQK